MHNPVQVTRTRWAPSTILLLSDVPLNAHPMAASEHSLLGEEAREMADQWCALVHSLCAAHSNAHVLVV